MYVPTITFIYALAEISCCKHKSARLYRDLEGMLPCKTLSLLYLIGCFGQPSLSSIYVLQMTENLSFQQ